jgi:hypothetical protein
MADDDQGRLRNAMLTNSFSQPAPGRARAKICRQLTSVLPVILATSG